MIHNYVDASVEL